MSAAGEDPEAVVDRLLGGVERGDVATVEACYAPGAKIWHNFTSMNRPSTRTLRCLQRW